MLRRAEAGFTLLEIIVALAIAATGIAAAAKITASSADVSFETEKRMVAVWVAGNRLSELRISRAWPALGGFQHQVDMGRRTWYVTDTVTETARPDLRRVEVTVYTNPERSAREFSLQGYVARYVPPEQVPEEQPASESDSGEAETDDAATPGASGEPAQGGEVSGDATGQQPDSNAGEQDESQDENQDENQGGAQ